MEDSFLLVGEQSITTPMTSHESALALASSSKVSKVQEKE